MWVAFCTAKATHIFFSKKFQHICESLSVNFNQSLTNDVISFEQMGPGQNLYSTDGHAKTIISGKLTLILMHSHM